LQQSLDIFCFAATRYAWHHRSFEKPKAFMSRYWTDTVNQLDPYTPGEQPQDQQYIKLNTNENPYPPSPRVISALDEFDKQRLRLYPDPESSRLRDKLADHLQVGPDNIFLGNGSDEVLAHAFQAFFSRPGTLLFPDISYSFYPVYCQLYEIAFETVPLRDDFSINIDDYAPDCAGVILPNPNAPTGRLLSTDDIEKLCRQTEAVVIIDEAYIDFGGTSAIALTLHYANLLVVQTFSKSRSLAGLRLGYAVGHPDLIDGLNRVKNSFNSYPIDLLAQTAAVASIEDNLYFTECCDRIIATRERLSHGLIEQGFEVLPSTANFVFASHPRKPASELYLELRQRGLLVRYFNKPRIDNFLRITVGSDREIDHLLETLRPILRQDS
jgi:histidinol-phosphate aminotransferase